MEYSNHEKFLEIFKQKYLKVTARSVSVATLLGERYLKKIVYDPYYQRNYVWENDKQSFFIESVLLGTEIPPIVLYKNGVKVEVIDGRQRFETIKRFKEDDFALSKKGLIELQALSSKKFSKLSSDIQNLFLNAKIRFFEYEVVGLPDLSPEIDDMVKKEIFRRYNSGITPLTQAEVDNAKYEDDEFTSSIRVILKDNRNLYDKILANFIPKSQSQRTDLIAEMEKELRKVLVLPLIPVSKYAYSGKTYLIDLFYDNYMNSLLENEESPTEIAHQIIYDANTISDILKGTSRNAAETLMWGLSILRNERIEFPIEEYANIIAQHVSANLTDIYQTENDHYYSNVVARFASTASLLKKFTGFDFKNYIRDVNFSSKLKQIKQSDVDAELTLDKLSGLRIHKPNPSSKPIAQILSELETDQYLIRPAYQRQEKIDVRKASSIIESILLGINLPPLFVFVRNDGVREVVDGQQRLLSIVGFLGKRYKNEEKKLVTAKNHSFRLQDLRIMKQYNGKKFTDIADEVEDALLDFNLDEIEIEQSVNDNFEPTDLFIRLNSKPYPIKPNTFEMWNSLIDKDVLMAIKEITRKNKSWFYVNVPKIDENGSPRDRMANEELITILSVICYYHSKGEDFTKVLGFYPRMEKLTCRVKTKSNITSLLESFCELPSEKELFLKAIQKTDLIIDCISKFLLNENPTKEGFNYILNIKNNQNFSRKSQMFYVLWLIMLNISSTTLPAAVQKEFEKDVKESLSILDNVGDTGVDQEYVDRFIIHIRKIQSKYTI